MLNYDKYCFFFWLLILDLDVQPSDDQGKTLEENSTFILMPLFCSLIISAMFL